MIIRRAICFSLFAVAQLAAAMQGGSYVRVDDRFLYAGNGRVELTIQKADGRLYALVDKLSRLDFLAKKDAWWSPFDFWMKVDGKDEVLLGANANRFNYETVSGKDGTTLVLTWEQFRTSTGRLLNVRVRITVEVPASEGLTYWRISVANNEDLVIREVDFPTLNGIPQLSRVGTNDYLAYPSMSGMLFRDPVNNFKLNSGSGGQEYPSVGSNMQFVAFYSSETASGLYLATQDTSGASRSLNAGRPASDWISLAVMYPLAQVARGGFSPSYSTVIGVFSGDWYDAAQIYRAWAIQQEWARNASLKRPGGAPDWFKSLAVHQWDHTYLNCQNNNPFDNVPLVAKSAADWAGAPMAVDWVGWERVGWYIDYPKVFPPKEGWASFDTAVARTQEQGDLIWLVADTTGFSSRVPEWTQAKPNALVDVQGGYLHPVEYSECGLKTTFYQMCPATRYWQEELRTLLLEFAQRKPDIVQLDGFPVVPASPCYSNSHGHVPGDPLLYATSYRRLFEGLKAEARRVNPRLQFSAEGMAEFYLGFLDSFWDSFTTGWSPSSLGCCLADPLQLELIPMWHAVYHDHTLIQSGLVLLRRTSADESAYYVRGLGRALVWGETPSFAADRGLEALDLPVEQAMKDYFKRIIQARRGYAASFLVEGRMLRPPAPKVPTIQLPGASDIPYTSTQYPPSTSPAVLGSLWQAPNGDAGYVLTNISKERVSFELTIDAASTLLAPQGRYEIYLVRNGAYAVLQPSLTLPAKVTLALEPMELLLAGITPASADAQAPRIAPNAIMNAASYDTSAVAPGQFFVIFGAGLGPREMARLRLDAQGLVAREVEGTRVLFDGQPAPLVYSVDGQVSGIAPYALVSKTTTQIQVEYRGVKSKSAAMRIAPTAPGIFTLDASGRGPGVTWNQDGSINSKANPARRGDIIAFWATGEGATTPEPEDGQVIGAQAPKPKAIVTVRIDGIDCEVLYAAAAPQAVAGVFQVNARVPEKARSGDALPLVLSVGGARSQGGVTISLR